MDTAEKELEKLGFSTKKSFYSSIEEIESTLFDGFFNVSDWKVKIKKEYKTHCERILNSLPDGASEYSYIQVPYQKNETHTDANIVDEICDSLLEEGPQLSIIEAPAGFGKTCTSYEIINSLVTKHNNAPIPFFTEFSRDRQARIFNHIFVREVDRSFSSVNSSVVIDEVKQGRIVVVLDGFDELLHDNSSESKQEGDFENAEPMLETISELLTNNAKIILTSRRSAIFDGEMFNEWLTRYDGLFKINRYKLDRPEISDWLNENRLSQLKSCGINVNNLSNPVLLGFLRFTPYESFDSLCKEPRLIVEKYFSSMLEREIDRQELRMSTEKQSELLRIIAEDMCDNNYTSDSKENIISIIKEKASHLLSEVRSNYSPKDKPTIDKLATTLSNHAFFDRSTQGENNIEFINEFVFGNYIADTILTYDDDWLASDERFVEPAVLSYISRDDASKNILWKKLHLMSDFLDSSSRMRFEYLLTGCIKDTAYSNSEINSITIKGIALFGIANSRSRKKLKVI